MVLKTTIKQILCSVLLLAVFSLFPVAHASGFRVVYSLNGATDGCYPIGAVALDHAGNLYVAANGAGGGCTYNVGSVFKLSSDGTEALLYAFPGGSAGELPNGLVLDQQGNLWGTTCCGGIGGGVIFKIDSKGHESVAHTFQGSPIDGCAGEAAMAVDASGNLYGTTFGCGKFGHGAVFKVKPDGSESLLYSFRGGHDGYDPQAGVTPDPQGNLYGATDYGGKERRCGDGGCGTVFELAPSGMKTQLYAFKGPPNDGFVPAANPILDASGNLYGTTLYGGISGCFANDGCGAVFELAPDGKETVLHLFNGGKNDGANSIAPLYVDDTGNLYGTTEFGGSNAPCNGAVGCGTVFEIAPDASETILHKFNESTDGSNPASGLVADNAGNLYGTAYFGGQNGFGTVFKITP